MTEGSEELYGVDAYWLGLRLTFLALFLMFLYQFQQGIERASERAGPVADSGVPVYAPQGSEEFLLTALALLLAVMILVSAVFSIFLYVALHGGTVVAVSEAGRTTLAIPPIPDPGTAELLMLIPPAVLAYAGYRQYQAERDVLSAALLVTVGYAIIAALAVVPAAWVFNEFLASAAGEFLAGTPASEATVLRITYPNPVETYLRVAGAYPLVFGGGGAVLAALFEGDQTQAQSHGGQGRQ